MVILKWIGWGFIALGVLSLLVALPNEEVFFVVSAVSSAMAGVLLLALDMMLTRLTEIRDAILHGPVEMEPQPSGETSGAGVLQPSSETIGEADIEDGRPLPTLDDLDRRISAAKKR